MSFELGKVSAVTEDVTNGLTKKREKSVTESELLAVKNDDDDTRCGYSCFNGPLLQKFANKTAFIIINGILSCVYSATFAYSKGTITTMEKRFGIPSRVTGIIITGNDFASIVSAPLLSYYCAKKHRPRWIAFAMSIVALTCLMHAALHWMYGPGEDALQFTEEYGVRNTLRNYTENKLAMEKKTRMTLCQLESDESQGCEISKESNLFPPIYLFGIQFLIGIFSPLLNSLGTSYMDDNMKKSETPVFISISYTVRMFGPALGYAVASFSLRQYIAPDLTPTITTNDSRWLGAWWLGWIVLFFLMMLLVFPVSMFPRKLPQTKSNPVKEVETVVCSTKGDTEKSGEMKATFKRLFTNKIFMLNNIASVFYCFGYLPYWMFTPKYIETQYRQSASTSNFLTGSVALIFTALGVTISGVLITKFKPSARNMAAWNVIVGTLSAIGYVAYIFLGCDANDKGIIINQPIENTTNCISDCHCDYVKYSPVCGEDGNTYISPCHAGCTEVAYENGTKYYDNCSCISSQNSSLFYERETDLSGRATPGSCPVDCAHELLLFMIVKCLTKFFGSTGRASNFLVSLRSVREDDKTVSIGASYTIVCLLALIPSPIVFGWILDYSCLVWGKTCTGQSNCWFYNGETMRYLINVTGITAIMIGALCDCGVWYLVKDLVIFDKEVKVDEKKGDTKDVIT